MQRKSLRNLPTFVFIILILQLSVGVVASQVSEATFDSLTVTSPDGNYQAFLTSDDLAMTTAKIWISTVDGQTSRELVASGENFIVTNPIWSPDSKSIAYLKAIESFRTEYEQSYEYELWRIDIDLSNHVMVTDQINPSIAMGSPIDVVWNSNNEIEFDDNSVFPMKRYAINPHTQAIRELGDAIAQQNLDAVRLQAQPENVPLFKQYDSRWAGNQLGTCAAGQTIGSHGCTLTAVSMVLKYYGADVDPQKLNNWVRSQGGFCDFPWHVAAGYHPGVSYVGRVLGSNKTRLNAELDAGHPVIVGVNNWSHYVVVTHRSGGTYYINDPGYNRTTLNEWGNTFDAMYIFHGPVPSGGGGGSTSTPSNLLSNGSFEGGLSSWSYIPNTQACPYTTDYSGATHGSKMLSTHRPDTNNCISLYQDVSISVQNGETYTAVFSGRRGWDGANRTGRLAIWLGPGSSNPQSSANDFVLNGAWHCAQTQVKATRNHSKIRFEIYLDSISHPDYQFDNMRLFRGAVNACAATTITSQPSNQTVTTGENVTFSVGATGELLSYQWQENTGSSWKNISGATATNYTLNNTQLNKNGVRYRVVIKGNNGSKTSNVATLTVQEPVVCKEDIDSDGAISILDIQTIAGNIDSGNLTYDVNGDGVLNILDVQAIAGKIGQACPA